MEKILQVGGTRRLSVHPMDTRQAGRASCHRYLTAIIAWPGCHHFIVIREIDASEASSNSMTSVR